MVVNLYWYRVCIRDFALFRNGCGAMCGYRVFPFERVLLPYGNGQVPKDLICEIPSSLPHAGAGEGSYR